MVRSTPLADHLRAPTLQDIPRLLVAVAALASVGWILYNATLNFRVFAIVSLNGLTLAALFFVVASGFTLIFGLMRVVNLAHGSLYLLAGYLAYEVQTRYFIEVGPFGGGRGDLSVPGWVVPALVAALAVGIIGLFMQQALLRWNQGQDLRQALITIAVSVILADQMLAHFGGIAKDITQPAAWPVSIMLPGEVRYSFFRLTIIFGSAVVIGLLLLVMLRYTRFGMIVRAGVDDRAMVSAVGININLVFAGAFLIGAFLAGYGGVIGGTAIALSPGEDTAMLLNSLIVVIIGGMGSLGGAAVGALLLGLVNSYANAYLTFGDVVLTHYSILLVFLLLIVVLAFRPLGLFGRPA